MDRPTKPIQRPTEPIHWEAESGTCSPDLPPFEPEARPTARSRSLPLGLARRHGGALLAGSAAGGPPRATAAAHAVRCGWRGGG